MEHQTIIYEVKDHVAWVTFNRPESMNAMNRQMTGELIEACREVEEDVNVRLAIFTGTGEKAFSAGMDLKERAETVFSPIERRQQKLTNKIYTLSLHDALPILTSSSTSRHASMSSPVIWRFIAFINSGRLNVTQAT